MGKAAKQHRKKVAARNQKLKSDYKKFEQAVQTFIKQEKEKNKPWHESPTYVEPTAPVMSAIDLAKAEKNKSTTK